jgi:hypothetical protein
LDEAAEQIGFKYSSAHIMGLLKKLGLVKKKSKQKEVVDVTTTDVRRSARLSGKAEPEPPASPEPDVSSNRSDSPEPENDFAAALRKKSTKLRHIEPPKPRAIVPTITQPAQDQSVVRTADDDNYDHDDEGEIEIGEVETEEEEENNAFLLAIRQKALQKNNTQEKGINKPPAEPAPKETKKLADDRIANNSQEKEINKPPAEPAPKETKKLADERVAQMFAKQKQDDESRAKNRADARVAEMFAKQKQNQADERVAQMFNKQNQNDTSRIEKDFGYKPPQKKGTSDERVAQMFAKSKPNNDYKPHIVGAHKLDAEERLAEMRLASKSSQAGRTKMEENRGPAVGKANEQKKAVEALLQQQHDPKGFLDSKKGSSKIEIPTASSTQSSAPGIEKSVGLSFAERRKLAEAISQRKVVTSEPKHMVDVSHENFGDKSSFAQRRKMLEAKSQGQKAPIMGSITTGAQFNPQQGGSPETQMKEEKGPSNESSDEDFVDLSDLQEESFDTQEGKKGSEDVVTQQGDIQVASLRSGPSRLSMAVAQAAAAKQQAP